jgi:K+-sensing histidine kinase KdpD
MSKVAPVSDKKSNKVSPDALGGGNDFLNDPPDVNPVIEGDEEEEEDNANKILDRSQLMDHMLFPENGATLVIVPSNKQGTGFLNHCYDEQYLKDHISEREFNAVVMVSSKLASKCYAKKKILDKQGVNPKMKMVLSMATLMAIASLWTVYESFNNGDNKILLYISHALISLSLFSVFISLVYNWMSKVVPPVTFNQMVKKDLDDFYNVIN